MIKIAGFQTNSFVDWPGKIASVVFLGGCNFKCYYCHNHHILGASSNIIPFSSILEQIKEQIGFIDGVVISGGEPTVHRHLREIIMAIRDLGLMVKLDTNGTNSDLLCELVESGTVDYVAMDVKGPLEKYCEIAGEFDKLAEVKKSIDYLRNQTKVDFMFRMTLAPVLTEEDIRQVGKLVTGAKILQLQQFVPNEFSNRQQTILLPYSAIDAKKFELELSKYVGKVILRGF